MTCYTAENAAEGKRMRKKKKGKKLKKLKKMRRRKKKEMMKKMKDNKKKMRIVCHLQQRQGRGEEVEQEAPQRQARRRRCIFSLFCPRCRCCFC